MRRRFINEWLATEVEVTPSFLDLPDHEVRAAIADDDMAAPPALDLNDTAALAKAGYLLYDDQGNPFVEKSAFYFAQSKLSTLAVTRLKVKRAVCLRGRVWTSGFVDMWVNGKRLRRSAQHSGMYPSAQELRMNLSPGENVIFVREQNAGIRPTRDLFGIELDNPPVDLEVVLPGDDAFRAMVNSARAWLASLVSTPDGRIRASAPPPCAVVVCLATGTAEHVREREHKDWPAGHAEMSVPPFSDTLVVHANFSGHQLTRRFEHLENVVLPQPIGGDASGMVRWQLEQAAANPLTGYRAVTNAMARRALGQVGAGDEAILLDALQRVDERPDCADFYLATLLRMEKMGMLDAHISARLKEVCLRFRYWMDEDTVDAMCFDSENHALLFHACQMIAGGLYPDNNFLLSHRTGHKQRAVGLERCARWAEKRVKHGFDEFLSSTYAPLTLGACLLVRDFSGDEALAQTFTALGNTIFSQMATHSFDGVSVGPQGRVYRDILYPHRSGAQAILSFADPSALPWPSGWLTHAAVSDYHPPQDVPALAKMPQDLRYTQASVEIVLHKTAEYMLTSLALPSSAPDGGAYLPGQNGGQQHISHAALARDCHVFVTHAGNGFDFGHSRPGYWYGNGILPAQKQEGATLLTLYNIPDNYPFFVTHVFWPAHNMDESRVEPHWAFGRRKDGFVAVWCSGELKPYSHTLQGKELRSESRVAGWVVFCGGVSGYPSFDAFIAAAKALAPSLDEPSLTLRAGAHSLMY